MNAIQIQAVARSIVDSVVDNWFDEGHSSETERMDREYALAAIDGHLDVLGRYPSDDLVRKVTRAAMKQLELFLAN